MFTYHRTDLQNLTLAYSNPLPNAQGFFSSARNSGLAEVGKYGAALVGILTLILVFKSFTRS